MFVVCICNVYQGQDFYNYQTIFLILAYFIASDNDSAILLL